MDADTQIILIHKAELAEMHCYYENVIPIALCLLRPNNVSLETNTLN